MEVFERVTILFAFVLALSLLIERLLEILKSAFDVWESKRDRHKAWTSRARETQRYIERRLQVFEHIDPVAARALLDRFSEVVIGVRPGEATGIPTISGDLVRAVHVRLYMKAIGIVLGTVLAFALSVNLFTYVYPEHPLLSGRWGLILTGVAIGLGAGPVHKIITALERRRRERETEAAHA